MDLIRRIVYLPRGNDLSVTQLKEQHTNNTGRRFKRQPCYLEPSWAKYSLKVFKVLSIKYWEVETTGNGIRMKEESKIYNF